MCVVRFVAYSLFMRALNAELRESKRARSRYHHDELLDKVEEECHTKRFKFTRSLNWHTMKLLCNLKVLRRTTNQIEKA